MTKWEELLTKIKAGDITPTLAFGYITSSLTQSPSFKNESAIWGLHIFSRAPFKLLSGARLEEEVLRFLFQYSDTRIALLKLKDAQNYYEGFPKKGYSVLLRPVGKDSAQPQCVYSYDDHRKTIHIIVNVSPFDYFLCKHDINDPSVTRRLPAYDANAKALIYRRLRKGVSSAQLADICNVSRSLICHIEKNRRKISLPLLNTMCDFLECEPFEICDYSEEFDFPVHTRL